MKAFAQRYCRNYGAVIGLVVLLLVVAVALLAPVLYEESPWLMVGDPLVRPFADAAFPFGTDMLGRDITAGMLYGARVSLLVGVISTGVALVFGILIGSVAGYCGGRIDDALMRFTEFFQTIPQLAMAVVIVAIFNPTIYSIVAAISVVSWPPVARLVRGEFLTLKQREFVQAGADIRAEGAVGNEVILHQQRRRQMREGADLVAIQVDVLLLRHGQHQLGGDVRREEVGDIEFRNPFVVDRDAVRRANAADRVGLAGHVEIGAAQAHHPVALRFIGSSGGRCGNGAEHGKGGNGGGAQTGMQVLLHDGWLVF